MVNCCHDYVHTSELIYITIKNCKCCVHNFAALDYVDIGIIRKVSWYAIVLSK